MRLTSFVVGALVVAPTMAGAERSVQPIGTTDLAPYDFVTTELPDQPVQFARQVLPPTGMVTSAVAQSRTIYLNKNGVTLMPGNNDSRTNRSSIPSNQVSIPPWNVSATVWTDTVSCVRELFAPFDVTVVDSDPGNVPHMEAVFGGSPGMVGLPNNVAGVSPYTLDCGIIENSIVFTFVNVIPQDARLACEIMAQEIAHSYGLDHELLASDPMTYLNYNGNRAFQNQTAQCGENTPRPCGLDPNNACFPNQNSVTMLNTRIGVGNGDNVAPTVGITAPTDGAVVPPGFDIVFNATDNVAVKNATLFVDDQSAGTLTAPPFRFTTSATLSEGTHTLRVEVSDGRNLQSEEITVTIRKGAPPNGGGNGGGDGSGDLTGGCSTGNSGGLALAGLALGAVALVRRRRR